MRIRLLRGVAALVVALAVVVPIGAHPARATTGMAGPVIRFGLFAIEATRADLTDAVIEGFVQEAIAAALNTRDQTLVFLTTREVAAHRSAAIDAVNEFRDYNVIRTDLDWLREWAFETSRNANLARQMMGVAITSDRRAADQIGLAASTMYDVALVAYKDAGLPQNAAARRAEYRALANKILTDLAPTCDRVINDTPDFIRTAIWTCRAATGDVQSATDKLNMLTGEWILPQVDVEKLQEAAAVNSSWLVAKRILPTL